MNEFKPLEKILKDDIKKGDLIMIREENYGSSSGVEFLEIVESNPVFYLGPGEHICDGRSGFERGKRFYGVRVATGIWNGRYISHLNENNSVFHDEMNGTLLPFNEEGKKYRYSLLVKKVDLPKIKREKVRN